MPSSFSITLSYFVPLRPLASKLLAVGLIAGLSAVNYCGIKPGAAVQNASTWLKLAGLAVIIGSEFGRTPMIQNSGLERIGRGRDHNSDGFTMLLAGGGVQRGITYGGTDEFGFKAIDKPVHVHDLHATILHLLGLDHTKLTYRYSGRDFRLTDVYGNVVTGLLA